MSEQDFAQAESPGRKGEANMATDKDGGSNGGQKHQLESTWTMWYDRRQHQGGKKKGDADNFEGNLQPVAEFGTVEDFWRYYNQLIKPINIEVNSNYHMFKKGIKPMWEDEANAKGGKWVITLKQNERDKLDKLWETVVLSLIGETVDDDNEICGAVISRRAKGDRVAVWNKTKSSEDIIMGVGRKVQAALSEVFEDKISMQYQEHEDSLRTLSSYSNPNKLCL